MAEDIVRVLRVVEYVGPRSIVEDTVAKSIHGTKILDFGFRISAATIGTYPEILGKVDDGADEQDEGGDR